MAFKGPFQPNPFYDSMKTFPVNKNFFQVVKICYIEFSFCSYKLY